MKVPLKGGYALDYGPFWATEDKIYWKSGAVWDNNGEVLMRISSMGMDVTPTNSVVDYSQWSEEKRAEVLAENNRLWAQQLAEDKKEWKEREALRASAKAKLTQEEYDAIAIEHDDYEP